MCGLVGVAGDLSAKEKDVFRELLFVDSLRGMHSTGAAFVRGTRNAKVTVAKQPGSPFNVMATKEWDDGISSHTLSVMLGHNRHATIGAKTLENAHPFEFSNIVGAHNGTLEARAVRALIDNEKFGTDSEALYHNLNEFNIHEVMAQMSGAWALTFYDKTDNTINFLRNKERPFYYTFNKTGDVIFWASESKMLRWILDRNYVTHGDIYELNPDVLVSFTVPNSRQKFGDPSVTEVSGWVAPPFVPTTRIGRAMAREDLPWADGKELEEMFSGWEAPKNEPLRLVGPSHIGPGHTSGSPVMTTGAKDASSPGTQSGQPSSKKGSGKKQNGDVVKSALPSGGSQPSTDTALNRAYSDGFVAGDRGLSKTQNPFPAGDERHDQWSQGRLAGLECFRPNKRTPREVELSDDGDRVQRVRAFNSEWITAEEFEARTGGTCNWNGCSVEYTDDVRWFDRETCVCAACVTGNKFVSELLGKAM